MSDGASNGVERAWRKRASTSATGQVLIEVDPRYFRPTEVELLLGDPSKAHQRLGWRHKTTFDELVKEMVEADLATVRARTRA